MRPEGPESTLSLPIALFMLLQAAAAAAPTPAPSAAERSIDDPAVPLTGFVPFGSYETNVRGALARAQSLQGPLDGAWVVADVAGKPLYRFQLVDSGRTGETVEGVWSDPAARTPGSGGFFASVQNEGGRTVFHFEGRAIWVAPSTAGGYEGELTAPAAPQRRVTMKRPSPLGP